MNNTKITDKTTYWYKFIKSGIVYCALPFLLLSCDNGSIISESPEKDQEVSSIDGKPIVKLQADEFYHGSLFDDFRNKLANDHGETIIRALNDRLKESQLQGKDFLPVKELTKYVRTKSEVPEIGSTHFRISEEDGETEDFAISLRRYHQNPARAVQKGSSQLEASTTYLALSPDRFYLQDGENGNEQWPVTFPATALDDPTDEISVTFNKDGFVSSSITNNTEGTTTANSDQPDLVFAEATPVIDSPQSENIKIDPCYPNCGGGGGGGDDGPYCTEVSGRGGPTGGSTAGTQTYFTINSIRLWATGDGDGAAELQMFVKQDDDYDGECFPRSYKYRFDTVVRSDPTNGGAPTSNTKITGADGLWYVTPDVNYENIDYSYFERLRFTADGQWYSEGNVGYFPLFNLTEQSGPWRLVLSDDDKDYRDFSRRRQSDFAQDIHTYDMSNGTWNQVFTGFSTDRKTYGSSDDPIRESGVRRITESSANERGGYNEFQATKSYSGGTFSYTFSLRDQ